ncbi:MAG: hypothetical protein IT548_09055 [Alphaproteobacteria bacterium]|nr:hypothetical protein [Alphaproteobacteria bacterium]
MMNLSAEQARRLSSLVEAGGLQSTADIVRLQIAAPRGIAEDKWRQVLAQHRTLITRAAGTICGDRDVVDLQENILTIFLHPDNRNKALKTRLTLLARISDALQDVVSPAPGTPAPKEESQPGASSIHRFDSVEFDLSALPIPEHKALVFQSGRTSAGLPLVFPRVVEARSDVSYYEPSDHLVTLDIAALRAASQVALKCLKLKIGGDRLRVLFPVNANNLRRYDARDALLFELRQVPDIVRASMQPALVRLEARLPSELAVAADYLSNRFDTIWAFTRSDQDPSQVAWPSAGMGLLVDASEPAREAATRGAWTEAAVAREALVAFLDKRTIVRR